MDSFWKWLMRANARGVCAAAMIALLLSGAWWTWKEFAPVRQVSHVRTHDRRERRWADLGLLSMLDAALAESNSVPLSPFAVHVTPRAVLPPAQADTAPPAQIPEAVQPEVVKVAVVPAVPPKPAAVGPPRQAAAAVPPTPETAPVRLTYRGLFRRPDGRRAVLIEDSESQGSRFYEVGQEVFGVRLGEPTEEGASLVLADGTTNTILLGQPIALLGGHCVD